jgi:S1-C subfamily serine protease
MGRSILRGFLARVGLALLVIASTLTSVNEAGAVVKPKAPVKRPPAVGVNVDYSTKGYPWVYAVGIREANIQPGGGVIALWVLTNSPAFRAGLDWGWQITFVDGARVSSLADLNNVLAARAGRTVSLTVVSWPNNDSPPLLMDVPASPLAKTKLKR